MKHTEIRYVIYQNRDGLLKEPKSYWSDSELMFPYWYSSQEEALQAINKEVHAPTSLIVLAVAATFWD